MLLSQQQLQVYPQAPGYPAAYNIDKLPKGALIALMPVVILPHEAYKQNNNCDEANKNQHTSHAGASLPLGVQPAPIPSFFGLNPFGYSGRQREQQCMCPCSCTQNIPVPKA